MATMIQRREEGAFFKPQRKFGERDGRGFPVGSRTTRRRTENKKLNQLPEHIKRNCEIRLPGCLGNKFLSWAHSKKSRFILTDKEWQEAARACGYCADALDHKMGHAEMKRRVTEAIKKRKLDENP
jgi:hypothetical protein